MVKIRKTGKSKAVRKNIAKNKSRPEEEALAPHSFVINNRLVTQDVYSLTSDFRRLMRPNTASRLQVSRRNRVRDFVPLASHFHVSHLCYFTNTESATYFKLCRLPRGPTLSFKVHDFTLTKDVVTQKKKQLVWEKFYEHSPLVILNGFSGEGMHFKLMANMFQNMFPTLNLLKINLNNIKRCVLINYDSETDLIDFRHYAITVKPTGVSKAVKKLLKQKVPDLSRFENISDFFMKSETLSDSEVEDDPSSIVTVPQKLISRGNEMSKKSAIRLVEMGPRLSLQLIKVQDNLISGEVLYHKLVQKTSAQILKTKKRLNAKRKLKEKRKREQALNVKAKEDEKEKNKKKSLAGMGEKKRKSEETEKSEDIPPSSKKPKKDEEDADAEQSEDDDDAEWYRQEVGEEPEKDLFQRADRPRTSKKPMLSKGWRDRQKKKKGSKPENKSDFDRSEEKPDRKFKKNFGENRHGKDRQPTKGFKATRGFKSNDRNSSKKSFKEGRGFKSNDRSSGKKSFKEGRGFKSNDRSSGKKSFKEGRGFKSNDRNSSKKSFKGKHKTQGSKRNHGGSSKGRKHK